MQNFETIRGENVTKVALSYAALVLHIIKKYSMTEEQARACCDGRPLELFNFDPELLCQHIIYQAKLQALPD